MDFIETFTGSLVPQRKVKDGCLGKNKTKKKSTTTEVVFEGRVQRGIFCFQVDSGSFLPVYTECKRRPGDKQYKDVCAFNGLPVPLWTCSTEPYCV